MKGQQHRSIILCLATEKGLAVAQSLGELVPYASFTICTFREQKLAECFADRIREAILLLGCRHVDYSDWKKNASGIIREVRANTIICVGWRYMITSEMRDLVGGNVIVAHDSLLPKFRGFAPLPTAMMCREQEAGVSFIQATDGVDEGPVFWQERFTIEANDRISDVIRKTLPLYVFGVRSAILGELRTPLPQKDSEATYSIWRDEADYYIDWAQSAVLIEVMVRALGSPYLGARARLGDRVVAIHKASVEPDLRFAIRQPGKVWCIDEIGRPTVICGEGMLKLHEATFSNGESLVPLKRLRVRFD
jgi:methionyl-tRNA formyltransferase